MPRIELLPEVLYQSMQPYHVYYDNLPLKNLRTLIELVNTVVDRNSQLLREAVGSAGTIDERLSESLNDDGSLKTEAVDNTNHSIEAHEDTDEYVRMLQEEREKLDLISEEATALTIQIGSASYPPDGETKSTLKLEDSESITWEVEAPNKLKGHMTFPAESAHLHFYEYEPVWIEDTGGQSYFKTTSVSTPFIEGSLRVFINGFRIFSGWEIWVSDYDVENWYETKFTPHPETGTFEINRIVSDDDVIYIDFDTTYES